MHDSSSSNSGRNGNQDRVDRIFASLIAVDRVWWHRFRTQLSLLSEADHLKVAFFPVDDLLGTLRYVSCPARGSHRRLVECWMCWCDVQQGHVALSAVLAAPPSQPRGRRV